jgi:hypothetical protein
VRVHVCVYVRICLCLYLLNNNALGVRRAAERVGLPDSAQVRLLVLQVRPAVDATVHAELATGVDTARLVGVFTHVR